MEDNKNIFPNDMSRQPFELPKDYFNDFSAKMDALIADQSATAKPRNPHGGSRSLFATIISSAAVFAGLIICGFVLLNMQKDVESRADKIIAHESYVDEMIEMVDTDYLEEVLADVEFD